MAVPDDAEEEEHYTSAMEIARKALNRQLADRTDARCISTPGKLPQLVEEYVKTVEVGEHVFYKPSGGKAK